MNNSSLLFSVEEGQDGDAEQTAQAGPYRLDGMHHQGKSGCIVFLDPKAEQRGNHHEMPRTDTSLHRNGYSDTTHREGDQPHRNTQITREVKRIKSNIEIAENTKRDFDHCGGRPEVAI